MHYARELGGNDREPPHPASPAATKKPTSEPVPLDPEVPPTDLAPPTSPASSNSPSALDLEDPFEVELVDWDEEDIDGAAPGMDVADAEAADAMAAHLTTMSSASKTATPMDPTGSVPVEHPKPTMNSALKTMPPDPARSAPVEHPKPPGASRPPVLGHAG